MNCAFIGAWNFSDLIICTMYNLGIPFDILSLAILAGFVLFALWARIDYNISLGLAAVVSYILMLINPGSQLLTIVTGLLAVGIALRVLIGIIAILRQ
jgi:hypothetical protein